VQWKPNVTVAAVIEREGRFLLVEERDGDSGRIVINQPAGHLDEGEGLIEAAVRETREETAWTFRPEALVGIYRWRSPNNGITYLRFAFCGSALGHDPEQTLDDGILHAVWRTPEELRADADRLRSPMVLRCIDDYLAGRRFPLDQIINIY
jgi:8-oxo-dGTP pyrophosphatase MutT (NUDIX family)